MSIRKILTVIVSAIILAAGGMTFASATGTNNYGNNYGNDTKKCYTGKGDARVEVECECPKVTITEGDKNQKDDKDKCVDKDVCLNLDGDYETIPTGYQANSDGVCTLIPPVVVTPPVVTPPPVTYAVPVPSTPAQVVAADNSGFTGK